jgi:hypothetical protein
MLELLRSSVQAGELAGRIGDCQQSMRAEQHAEFLKCCSICKNFEFWVPIGHADSESSRRCWKCKPPPSQVFVGLKIGFAANSSVSKGSSESIGAFGETTAAFGPYYIGTGKSACPRCSGALVKFDQTGYRCGTCIHKLDAAILDELLWGGGL